MAKLTPDHGDMRVPRKKRPPSPQLPRPSGRRKRDLYIGQWIRALRMRQVDVVRATGMNEGYLSELCSGKTDKVPGSALLADIAEALGIPMDYLYKAPPTQDFIQEAASIDPAVLARLRPRDH